jgi:hypothetical protein
MGRTLCALAVAALLGAPPRASADGWRASVSGGVAVAYDQPYLTLGGLIGHQLALGFEVELKGDYWFANTPRFFKLAPGLTWHAPLPFGPYLGGYYAHWFVESPGGDANSLGVRGGITVVSTGALSVLAGLAYERRLDCAANCTTLSSELMAGVTF